tara:strand:- start:142 stop:1128 length:987 start_codon:yes stop_codon:yes gene_type:complete
MQLSEARLRQIILEEVQICLIDLYAKEELHELDATLTEAEKDSLLKRLGKSARQNAFGLGTAGALAGVGVPTYMASAEHEAGLKKDRTEKAAEDKAERESLAQKKIELETYMNNPAAFRWGVGGESMMQLPGEEGMGGTSVLPASYSVIQQMYIDKKNGKPRYGIPDLDKIPEMTGEQSEGIGDPIKNLQTFFTDFSESQMVDASAALFGEHPKGHPKAGQRKYPHVKRMAASGLESKILMLDPRALDPNYVLPENGMTVKDYYNWAFFNQFLSAEEKQIFDMGNPEREADTQTTTQHSVGITPDKKFTWKESRVTWKNYKNRKKVLA